MRRKKPVDPEILPNIGAPVVPSEGVIDLDPTLPEGVVRSERTVAEYTQPQAEAKRRTRKPRQARPEKPLVDVDRVHAKAVDAFESYWSGEFTTEGFLARLKALKDLQAAAEALTGQTK